MLTFYWDSLYSSCACQLISPWLFKSLIVTKFESRSKLCSTFDPRWLFRPEFEFNSESGEFKLDRLYTKSATSGYQQHQSYNLLMVRYLTTSFRPQYFLKINFQVFFFYSPIIMYINTTDIQQGPVPTSNLKNWDNGMFEVIWKLWVNVLSAEKTDLFWPYVCL